LYSSKSEYPNNDATEHFFSKMLNISKLNHYCLGQNCNFTLCPQYRLKIDKQLELITIIWTENGHSIPLTQFADASMLLFYLYLEHLSYMSI
jgi:hypothetical protein